MSRRRKGVSTIIGAAIFVGILVLAFSSLQFFMRDLTALSDSYTKMTMLDEDRRMESLVIDQISLAEIISESADMTASSSAGGALYPINNMNFTDNADGWYFSAILYNTETPPDPPIALANNVDEDCDGSTNDDKRLKTTSNGVLPTGGFSGGWSSEAVPSPSGGGSIYSHFSFVSPNNKHGGAMMKWTYPFSLDADTASAIQDAVFSLGYYIPRQPDTLKVKGPADGDKAIIFYTITNPNGITYAIEIEQEKDEISWNTKHIPSSRICTPSAISWIAGEYKLQLTVMVDLQGKPASDKKVSEWVVYFDDVGIKFNLKNASSQSVTVSNYDDFKVTSPQAVGSLDFSIRASSSVPAKQYVFLYDFARSEWTLIGSSSISSTSSNVKLTKQSLDMPRFVAQIAGDYTVDPNTTRAAAVGDIWVRVLVTANTATPFTYSATLSFDAYTVTDDKVSFTVSNVGGITAHIVRYWIVTGNEIKSVDTSTYIDPGRSVTLLEDISPTSGMIEIRIVTDRGSVISLSTNV